MTLWILSVRVVLMISIMKCSNGANPRAAASIAKHFEIEIRHSL